MFYMCKNIVLGRELSVKSCSCWPIKLFLCAYMAFFLTALGGENRMVSATGV